MASPPPPPNSHLQNAAKNNFCATSPSGQPETFTPQMLVDLQASTHVSSGPDKEPSDRKPLQDLGEGKLIRMKASSSRPITPFWAAVKP